MSDVKLVLLIGQYSQNYYLGGQVKSNLTETVRHYKTYLPHYFPLPHPSPRNNIWQKKNAWFVKKVIPDLRKLIEQFLFPQDEKIPKQPLV